MVTQLNEIELEAVQGGGFWADVAAAVAEAIAQELRDMMRPQV